MLSSRYSCDINRERSRRNKVVKNIFRGFKFPFHLRILPELRKYNTIATNFGVSKPRAYDDGNDGAVSKDNVISI